MSQEKRSLIIMHCIVLIYGFTGILGKLITLEAMDLVWWRMLIASAGIAGWMLYKKRGFSIPRKLLLKYILVGLIIAAHWAAFFRAIKVSNVSVTLACLSSASLFAAFLEPLFFRTKIKSYEVFLGLLVIGGLLMIFNFETEYTEGIITALISAFLAALFTVINGKMIKSDRPVRISLYEMIGGTLGITAIMAFTGGFSSQSLSISAMDAFWLLLLGLVATAFAFVASVKVMDHLSPFTVTLTINMEPVYSILLALLIFGESERMSVGFYGGAVVIIGALFLNALLKRDPGKVFRRMRAFFPGQNNR